jgi:hypothetical protein
MLTPSYDFNLFGLDNFSPLTAGEFGAGTSFSANDPVSFVNYSLNQLASSLQPYNPLPYLSAQVSPNLYGGSGLIIPQSPLDFFQGGTPSRSVMIQRPTTPTTGGGQTTNVNIYQPSPATAAQQGAVDTAKGVYDAATAQFRCNQCKALNAMGGQQQDCTPYCGAGAGAGAGTATDQTKKPAAPYDCKDGFSFWHPIDSFKCLFPNMEDLGKAATLLIAVVVIILLILFVRRDGNG